MTHLIARSFIKEQWFFQYKGNGFDYSVLSPITDTFLKDYIKKAKIVGIKKKCKYLYTCRDP
ncbi:hypothetical protein [Arsenophonus symbiont of Ornithomya chloropus]|uniref:hypothetical protein n=1 Tax=Arsenophonus symbiont of Ornithomya chloropus TaxID=634121 RepID=UPI0032B15184